MALRPPVIDGELLDEPAHRLGKEINDAFDLTLVFNRHHDRGDAIKSTEHIPRGSIVFTEGVMLDLPQTNDLELYNLCRIIYGAKSDEFQQAKGYMLESLRQNPGESVLPWVTAEYEPALLEALIENECVILPADYRPFDEDKYGTEARDANTTYGPAVAGLLQQYLHGTSPDLSSASYVDEEAALQSLKTSGHTIREVSAVSTVAERAKLFSGLKQYIDLDLHSSGGKLSAYMVYGTAHSRSLEHVFNALGCNPHIDIKKDMPEANFLDTVPQAGPNTSRRIALAALFASGHNVGSMDYDQVYKALEVVNGNATAFDEFIGLCRRLNEITSQRERGEGDPDVNSMIQLLTSIQMYLLDALASQTAQRDESELASDFAEEAA